MQFKLIFVKLFFSAFVYLHMVYFCNWQCTVHAFFINSLQNSSIKTYYLSSTLIDSHANIPVSFFICRLISSWNTHRSCESNSIIFPTFINKREKIGPNFQKKHQHWLHYRPIVFVYVIQFKNKIYPCKIHLNNKTWFFVCWEFIVVAKG